MKKVIKIIGIILLIIIGIIVVLFVYLSSRPSVPKNYIEKVKTGGEIEAKYLKNGNLEVSYFEQDVLENYKKYEVYYPSEMETNSKKYPLIVVSNGTGVKASKYKEWFKHLASYGFIVIGNEEEYSWSGFSAEMSLKYLLRMNETKDSIFYNHIDTDNIGTIGHSQGGVGVINTITDTKHSSMYKTAVALSPSMEKLAQDLEWEYDASLINIPILLLSSTGNADENLVISLEGLESIYNHITASPFKIMGRRNDADHGDMLYFADGYVTAWFMWQLQNDEEASKAFIGNNPEIKNNQYYQDIKVDEK